MPLYSWKCKGCGRTYDLPRRTLLDSDSCSCGGTLRRDYSTVQLGGNPSFQPHFNHAVGQVVNSDKEFRDALKRGGEKAGSEFVPVYPGDIPRPTKDDHIFETRAKTIRDNNLNEADLRR